MQLGLEVQQLLVDVGEDSAVHQQVAQVGDGAPVEQLLQRVMGQGDVLGGQVGQQGLDLWVAQPELCVERVGHGYQRVERRDQRWMDTPGAVVGGMVELVGQRAGGAEPSGVQVPLETAPRAVDPRGFIARVILQTVQVTALLGSALSRRSPRCLGGVTTRCQRYVCFIPVGL